MAYLKINGLTCGVELPEPAHGGFSISIQDVDSASTGRGADGNMIRDRVAVKRKINLKFPPLTSSQMSAILSAVSGVSFSVEYPDPESATLNASGTFYCGDRTAPVYMADGTSINKFVWENVSFNLIEM